MGLKVAKRTAYDIVVGLKDWTHESKDDFPLDLIDSVEESCLYGVRRAVAIYIYIFPDIVVFTQVTVCETEHIHNLDREEDGEA